MKKVVYVVALIAGIAGIVGNFVSLPIVTEYSKYLVMGGFVLLAIGYLVKHKQQELQNTLAKINDFKTLHCTLTDNEGPYIF